jgi:hypothetical protein
VKNLWVWMLAAAVISAIVILWGRWQVEKSNNTVELVMDYRAAELLCQNADYPLDAFLRQARDRGLTSVAVGERTIKDIATLGQVYAFSGRQILDYDRLSPVRKIYTRPPNATAARASTCHIRRGAMSRSPIEAGTP